MGCSNGITKKSDNSVTDQSDNTVTDRNVNLNIYKISSVKELNSLKNIFINNQFKFSVEYPVKWKVKEEQYLVATIDHNPSPDGGINIFVESKPDEKIYVFGQVSQVRFGEPGFQVESFVTNSGMKGTIFSNEVDGNKVIYLTFNDVFIGASMHISIECFNQNKEQIMNILKSIKPI